MLRAKRWEIVTTTAEAESKGKGWSEVTILELKEKKSPYCSGLDRL